jgi:hypothetical protein
MLAVCLDNARAERFRSLVQRSSDLTLVATSSAASPTPAAPPWSCSASAGRAGRAVRGRRRRRGRPRRPAGLGRRRRCGRGDRPAHLPAGAAPRRARRALGRGDGDGPERGPGGGRADAAAARRHRAVPAGARAGGARRHGPVDRPGDRRRFDEALRSEIERCRRTEDPLTLLLLESTTSSRSTTPTATRPATPSSGRSQTGARGRPRGRPRRPGPAARSSPSCWSTRPATRASRSPTGCAR